MSADHDAAYLAALGRAAERTSADPVRTLGEIVAARVSTRPTVTLVPTVTAGSSVVALRLTEALPTRDAWRVATYLDSLFRPALDAAQREQLVPAITTDRDLAAALRPSTS